MILEREEGWRDREKHPSFASHTEEPTGDRSCRLDVCPEWAPNPQPVRVRDGAPVPGPPAGPCRPCGNSPVTGVTTCQLQGGTLPKPEFIYQKVCIDSYMFKLGSPSKCPPLDARLPSRALFRCSKRRLSPSILPSFRASAIFCFTSSTSAKRFPLRTFSSLETKTSRSG